MTTASRNYCFPDSPDFTHLGETSSYTLVRRVIGLHIVHARLGQVQRRHCRRRGRDSKERIGAESTTRGSSDVWKGGRALCHWACSRGSLPPRLPSKWTSLFLSCTCRKVSPRRRAAMNMCCCLDRPVRDRHTRRRPVFTRPLNRQGTISSRDEAARTALCIGQAAVRWRCRRTMRIRSSR